MIRKITLAWTVSSTLAALGALRAPRRRGRGPALIHDELRRELHRAISSLEEGLALFSTCLSWLESRGIAILGRSTTTDHTVLTNCLRGGEFHLDLARLEGTAGEETRGIEGRAHCSIFALRTALRALSRDELFSVTQARAGTRRSSLEELLREVERIAKRLGFRGDDTTPARFTPRTEKRAAPPTAPQATPKKPSRARTPKTAPVGFGGLPDDAESDAPPAANEPSPTTPTPDAEFFLHAAQITTWPCRRELLDQARRQIISRLHPDRAGEASARDFHRAIKGHLELIKLLEALPAPEAPPPPSPTDTRAPRRARPPRAAAPATPITPSQTGAPSPTIHEWPPRPAPAPPRPEPRAPRRPDPDSDFFLHEAALTWPCTTDALRTAWQTLAGRLRRMTPASAGATAYARASRGFTTLVQAAASPEATP